MFNTNQISNKVHGGNRSNMLQNKSVINGGGCSLVSSGNRLAGGAGDGFLQAALKGNDFNVPLFISCFILTIGIIVIVIMVAVMLNKKSSYKNSSYKKSGYQVPRFSQEFSSWNPRGYQNTEISQNTQLNTQLNSSTPVHDVLNKLDTTNTAVVPSNAEISKIPETTVSQAIPRDTYRRKL